MRPALENRIIQRVELLQDSNLVTVVNPKDLILKQQQKSEEKANTNSPLNSGNTARKPSTPAGKLHPALKRTPGKKSHDPVPKEDEDLPSPVVSTSKGILQCLGMGTPGISRSSHVSSSPQLTILSKDLSTRRKKLVRKKPQATSKAKKRQRGKGKDSSSEREIKKTRNEEDTKPQEPMKDDRKKGAEKDKLNYQQSISRKIIEDKDKLKQNDSSLSDIFSKTPPPAIEAPMKINIISPSRTRRRMNDQREQKVHSQTGGRVLIVPSIAYIQPSDKTEKTNSDDDQRQKPEKVNIDDVKQNNANSELPDIPSSKVSVASSGSQVSFIRTSTPANLMDSGLTQFGASLSIIRSGTPTSPSTSANGTEPKNTKKEEEKRKDVKSNEEVHLKGAQCDKQWPEGDSNEPCNDKQYQEKDTKRKGYDKDKVDGTGEDKRIHCGQELDSNKVIKQKYGQKHSTSTSSLERHKRSYSESDVNSENEPKKLLPMKQGDLGRKLSKSCKSDHERQSPKGISPKV